MPGKLTTHVLDTAQGKPAEGVEIELRRIEETGGSVLIKRVTTNSDGRTSEPLLGDGRLEAATYELVFLVGDYFASQQPGAPQPAFLDRVPVRFHVADAGAHYHVPLLVSPWAYSTYRGS